MHLCFSLRSPRGDLGACRVGSVPVDQSLDGGSACRPARLAKEGLHPQSLHLRCPTCLPAGHARGFQRSVAPLSHSVLLSSGRFPAHCPTAFTLTLWSFLHPCTIGDTLDKASDLVALLLQTVDKAAAQNSQHVLLAEGMTASVLLSRLALLETHSGQTSSINVVEFITFQVMVSFFGGQGAQIWVSEHFNEQ